MKKCTDGSEKGDVVKMSRSPSSALSLPLLGEGSPTKIDYREKIGYPYSQLSNLEDLDVLHPFTIRERCKLA